MKTIQEYIELLAARNELIRELQERISGLEAELDKREIELRNLKRMHFGQSSEKMKKPESLEPMPLFPEYDEATVEAMDNTLPPIATSEIVDAIEEETKQRKAKKKTSYPAHLSTFLICLSYHSHPIRPFGAPSPGGEGYDTRKPAIKKPSGIAPFRHPERRETSYVR